MKKQKNQKLVLLKTTIALLQSGSMQALAGGAGPVSLPTYVPRFCRTSAICSSPSYCGCPGGGG